MADYRNRLERTSVQKTAEGTLKDAALEAKGLINSAAIEAAKILKDAAGHVVNIEVMANDLSYVRKDIADIKTKLENDYVTQDQFRPVQRGFWGLLGLVGTAMTLYMLQTVFHL